MSERRPLQFSLVPRKRVLGYKPRRDLESLPIEQQLRNACLETENACAMLLHELERVTGHPFAPIQDADDLD